MVDAADLEKIESSKTELQLLLDKPQLSGIPVHCILCFSVILTVILSLSSRFLCLVIKWICPMH